MKRHRINSIITGLLLILFAVMLMLNKMGILTAFPPVKMMLKVVLIAILIYFIIVNGFGKRSFLGVTVPLGIIACLFSDLLGIGMVSPVTIILVSVLVGIGLSMIFGHTPRVNVASTKYEHRQSNGFSSKEYSDSEGTFAVDNSLGERTAYMSVNELRHGKIENALGSLTVYLNGTSLDEAGATIDIDNGLGKLQVYVPKEFRVRLNADNGLGSINTHGTSSTDTNQPLLTLNVDNGLGTTDIYFE